jgi:hypothetical protein
MSDQDRCGSDHCITCADQGVAMEVVAMVDEGVARCAALDGDAGDVLTALVEPVGPGDRLLVHAGVALAHLDGPG